MTTHRRATNFPGLLPPDRIMAMARTNQCMGDFMQNRIFDMIKWRVPGIMAGQRNGSGGEITQTRPATCMVIDYPSVRQAMFPQQVMRQFKNITQTPLWFTRHRRAIKYKLVRGHHHPRPTPARARPPVGSPQHQTEALNDIMFRPDFPRNCAAETKQSQPLPVSEYGCRRDACQWP